MGDLPVLDPREENPLAETSPNVGRVELLKMPLDIHINKIGVFLEMFVLTR